ncbi:hypothetical protein [Nocardia bovistercoris]|uniref:Mce-associated membrane protein n=1 Tax=Nocardia bovistercoris TaxID=2785916 RepID=A0A931IDB3_9NOCA|nr:hypothetical protein [Nocardia bovistercoris]MBH0778037.1 hypothetical protein [Nocardia bovistercoris]
MTQKTDTTLVAEPAAEPGAVEPATTTAEPAAAEPATSAAAVEPAAASTTSTGSAAAESATEAPVSVRKESADKTEGSAEPEFVMPSKWAIRRMVAMLIWRKIRVPLVIAVAVVALVLAIVFGWKLKQDNNTEDAAAAGLAAARAYAVTLTSVDSGNLDRDFTAVLDGSTGEFKDMYTRSSGQLRQLLLDNKATGKGTVLDAAVKSASPTKVEVLLFIDQTVTNTASADPRVDRSRVAMTMELVDGRWLASRVAIP